MGVFKELYAQTMYEIVGVGVSSDYYYWAYTHLGLSPQLMVQMGFVTPEKWQVIHQDWNGIENEVKQQLNCQ